MEELPKGWPIRVRKDASGEAENRRDAKGEIVGISSRSWSRSGKLLGRVYQIIFRDETDGQAFIEEAWLIPELVFTSLIDAAGAVIDRVRTDQPLKQDEEMTIGDKVWSVVKPGGIEFNTETDEYVQTLVVKRYI